ncbi:MAG TPA: flagellar biosynthetic protein FliQ [Candidatus Acidoferrum sp.]|nr:flagellar biosynthetic protein FliQ [Candidatus Acidoferrum sp.]
MATTNFDLIAVCKDAVMTALLISAPFLIVSLVLGLAISVLQAATQIHEQNIVFVPKIVATGLLLIFLGSWMITVMTEFTQRVFAQILA